MDDPNEYEKTEKKSINKSEPPTYLLFFSSYEAVCVDLALRFHVKMKRQKAGVSRDEIRSLGTF
jgi:hypothetical protein